MVKFILIMVLLSLLILPAFSQECDILSDPFCDDPDEEVPLDGGVGFLIAAATLYGIKQIKRMNGNAKS